MQSVYDAILKIDILCPPDEYVRQLLAIICNQFGYPFGAAYSISEDDSVIFSAYQLPEAFPSSLEPIFLQTDDPYLERVDEGIMVLRQDDPSPKIRRHLALLNPLGICMVIHVPMFYQEKMLGAYELYSTSVNEVSPEAIELFEKIAEMISIALASNEFLDQLSERTRELQEEIIRRKKMETALRDALRERKALEEIINRSPLVVWLWDIVDEWKVEFVSKSIAQYGYLEDDFYSGNVSFFDLIHPDDIAEIRESFFKNVRDLRGSFKLEFRILDKLSDFRWVELQIWLRRDTSGQDRSDIVITPQGMVTHLQGIMHDITERKHAEEMIQYQASHDMLTGLPNRLLFHDRLDVALKHAKRYEQRLAVMFLDLDHFKTINDTLGHAVGDLLLQGIANRIQGILRAEDTVSRLGGDEFTILLAKILQHDDAGIVAKKILKSLSKPFDLDGNKVHISASIGISLYPDDGQDEQTLLKNADSALYQAKEHGRNNLQFFSKTPETHSSPKPLAVRG